MIWEPDAAAGPDGSLREEIVLSFPKPAGASRAALIANAATGLWGSYMIKRMVELYGRGSSAWLASLDRDPAAVKALHSWGESEGTYRLPVEVQEGATWHARGSLPGGGPLLAEDRAIPLDIHDATGDQMRIRLRPPAGFWAFNSFRIAYGIDAPKRVRHVAPQYARTVEGMDVLPSLKASDDRYYSMPYTTDRAEIRFAAPPEEAGLSRTLFLHSRGWYQLHLRNSAEPNLAAIEKLMTQPGASAQFAADRFAEWRQGIVR